MGSNATEYYLGECPSGHIAHRPAVIRPLRFIGAGGRVGLKAGSCPHTRPAVWFLRGSWVWQKIDLV